MIKKLVVSFFGSGYLPIAPGTWGSLAAAIVFFAVAVPLIGQNLNALWILFGGLTLIAYGAGIMLGPWATAHYRSKDPKPFVLDEVAGMWLAMLILPFTDIGTLVMVLLVQFILFRLFDILKPTPARQAERLFSGWGIMTDDIIAGIYANFCGQIIFRVIFPVLNQNGVAN